MDSLKRFWAWFTRSWVTPLVVGAVAVGMIFIADASDPTPQNDKIELDGWYIVAFWAGALLFIVGLLGLVQALNRGAYAGDRSREVLNNLSTTLDRASAAISAIQAEIFERSNQLERLKRDIASIETLSQMTPEQIEHVLLAERRTRSRARDWVLVVAGGVVGAVLGRVLDLVFS